MLQEIWAKVGPYVESWEAIMNTLAVFGIARDSKRRGGKVFDEKKAPNLAIDAWHRHRYVGLTTRKTGTTGNPTLDVTGHERTILTAWMQSMHEMQQDHFKVSIANLSWAADGDPNKDAKFQGAVNYLKALAALATHAERTAMADGDDYIKDPVTEYWIVWLQELRGKAFTETKEICQWLVDPSADGFLAKLNEAYAHGKTGVHDIDQWIEDNVVPELVAYRNRLGVTVQRPAPPAGFLARIAYRLHNFENPLALNVRARRFK